jgi:hypothetical protein
MPADEFAAVPDRPADIQADTPLETKPRRPWRTPTIERLPFSETRNGGGPALDGIDTGSILV